jgi:hypothetical protein
MRPTIKDNSGTLNTQSISLWCTYEKLCDKYGIVPDRIEFLMVEREAILFVQECVSQGKVNENNCPVDIIPIDNMFFLYVKIVPPTVIRSVLTKSDLISLGYKIE